MNKKILRNKILNIRNSISLEEVNEKSKKIYDILINSDLYSKSNIVMSYISFKNEVDTFEVMKKILDDNKTLIVPKTTKDFNILPIKIENFNDLEIGNYGILEPKSNKIYDGKMDLILVPGICFDKSKNRIGFGKGYYDRLLKDYYEIIKIGLCYDFQIVDEIETDIFDIKMDNIITNKGFIEEIW